MSLTEQQQREFIEKIAPLVQKYAPIYGIKVCSPIIAQAILESAYGTSNKVKSGDEWRYNYFGLKWRDRRCEISNAYFEEYTKEQNTDGSYITIISKFCKFDSMEEGVHGYFQWTNTSNYSNLKGVTDPQKYLENIKADKYATSINYVANVMSVIKKWGLEKYDTLDTKKTGGSNTMVINVHAGHNPDGMRACGAIGIIKESTEARKVKDLVISYLQQQGHTVYDCTVDENCSSSQNLYKIVSKCNAHKADLDVSIHFNAGAKDLLGNKKTTGVEVLIYNAATSSIATSIVNSISSLGFTNRGVKIRSGLYVLRNTNAPAVLIECCFVDDKDDCELYDANKMAKAIAEGITKKPIQSTITTSAPSTTSTNSNLPFIVKCLYDMNIRNSPNGKILYPGGCKKGIKYTIVKVEGSWGYLKSGRGWICIDSKYVERS